MIKANRQIACKIVKVSVSRKNCQAVYVSNCADEEIGVGALNALRTADVEKFGRPFEMFFREGQIRKRPHSMPYSGKLGGITNSGQKLLTNRSYDRHFAAVDQVGKMLGM